MKRYGNPHPSIALLVIACTTFILITANAQCQAQHQENTPDEHRLPQFRQHAEVELKVAGKTYSLSPNEIGVFPMVYVQPWDTIVLKTAYREGKSGEGVDVQVEDGGLIVESKSIGHHGKLDHEGKLAFSFQVTNQLGIYRVILRKGEDIKQLEFWVGDRPPQGAPVNKIPKF